MQNNPEKISNRLITFSLSHYCEKARWALERLEVPYIEEPHVSLLHRLATSRYGGRSVPLLVTETGIFDDSTDILQHLDEHAPINAKLYPTDIQLRNEVEKLEDLFDTQLGPSTRRWFYSHLLDKRKLMLRLFCEGVDPVEQELFPMIFPCVSQAMRQFLDITAESAARSLQEIRNIFETVNELLADGRVYLVGDRFSAADLTFACLAAPVIMPKEYSISLPQLDEIPAEMAATIEQFRETPAGSYALRLFASERRRSHSSPSSIS